ncbi:hypothetical protein NC99_41880 [Sunxiuqinia dokdonensis]|uniref:Uncharacterized protein n=1 Tax=Sunxiuqinia dokdonensis TaxID=1409788 RepID=A0A0L8V404_9BACT|nr:hypothetical protein NC99_41880 [Sunxiuqinia dokdonensis]
MTTKLLRMTTKRLQMIQKLMQTRRKPLLLGNWDQRLRN